MRRLAQLRHEIGGVIGAALVLVLHGLDGHADTLVARFFQEVDRLDHLVVIRGFNVVQVAGVPQGPPDLHGGEVAPVEMQPGLEMVQSRNDDDAPYAAGFQDTLQPTVIGGFVRQHKGLKLESE